MENSANYKSFGKLCLILFPAFSGVGIKIMKLWASLPFEFHIFTTREVLSRAHWPPHVPGYLLLHCRLCNLHRRYRHRRHLWSSILIAIIMIIVRGFCKVLTTSSQCFSALYSVLNDSQCCLESVRYYHQSRKLFASNSFPACCLFVKTWSS